MAPTRSKKYQYACLPFKVVDGEPLVMLITSRETRRWIIPKGRPEKGRKAWEVAAQEAYEEAGLIGRISDRAIGAFPSTKRLVSGLDVPVTVRVFLFDVVEELEFWPEQAERERRWASPGEAALLVSEAQLAQLILEFSALWP